LHQLELFCKNTAPDLCGFNVTIPYKEQIIPFLDDLDSPAKTIGAVNTVVVKNGRLIGYNTDFEGFKSSLLPFLPKRPIKALILGTGGASKAVAYALRTLNIPYLFISRNPDKGLTYQSLSKEIMAEYSLVINTTPIGMFPNIDQFPDIPYPFLTSQHLLYDLVYNPALTTFLKKGQMQGAQILNGLKMLELQAEKAWEIWNQE
jgi:shikimate dehydrogenase